MADTLVPSVLYGVIQADNPGLTLPYSSVMFSSPAMASVAQNAANGKNSVVTLSATGYSDTVDIFYDKIDVSSGLPFQYGFNDTPSPYLIAPMAAYTNTTDFAAVLNANGIPIDVSDIVPVSIPDHWPSGFNQYYQGFATSLIQWTSDNMGYTSSIWMVYGPPAPITFSDIFQRTSVPSDVNGGNALTDYPEKCLSTYNSTLSQATSGAGIPNLSRREVVLSNLVVLDAPTSAANGNAEVSCTVTYAENPLYPGQPFNRAGTIPFYPFFTGSQTVYYNRYDVVALFNAGNIWTTSAYVDSSHQMKIPLGSALGTTVLTSGDLLDWISANSTVKSSSLNNNYTVDKDDILIENLPTAYGGDGIVVYTFTISNSYRFIDGGTFSVLLQAAPIDMSVIVAGQTTFAASGGFFAGNNNQNLLTTTLNDTSDIAKIALNMWANNYGVGTSPGQDDVTNWGYSLTSAIVSGSLRATTPSEATANSGCGWTCTVRITTAFNTSFDQDIFFDKIDVSLGYQDSPGNGCATAGVMTLATDSVTFATPMRIIDWLISFNLYIEAADAGNVSVTPPNLNIYFTDIFVCSEFDNLESMTYRNADGNIEFTLAAAPGATTMEGSVQVIIKEDATLPTLVATYP